MTSAALHSSGQRGRAQPPRMSNLVRLRWTLARNWVPILALIMAVAVVTAGKLGYIDRAGQDVARLAGKVAVNAGLAVGEVQLAGLNRTEQKELLAALAISRGDALLGIDIEATRTRVEAMPWVRTATISRLLPDRLSVHITERQPFALWQLDGALWLIDSSGVRITNKDLHVWRALPLVVGAGAADGAGELLGVLEREPGLSRRVVAAVMVGERRWDIRFDNGIRLMLPENDADYGPAAAWSRFASLERSDAILEREVAVLDMRLPDRLVVRVTPEGLDKMQDDGRRT